jgi:glycosyltransferase involved in cell wall biosynthesis
MRIAQVAPLYESVPPLQYGGTERVVSHLTEELVRLGHEVTLFASGDSVTSARLIPGCERSLWNDPECRDFLAHHIRQIGMVFEDVSRFDIVHFHADYLHYPLLRHSPCRAVTTIHGRIFPHDVRGLYEQFPETPLISISDFQRRPLPDANWQATVYHGIPRDLYGFSETGGDYLAFVGRVSPEKRIDRAIEIAGRAGMKLKVAARIDPKDEDYYHEQIEPLFRKHKSFVEFVGQIGDDEKQEFLGNAAALLFPIDWPEPFGLVMIEALACGTPVIAWRNGSVPEVVDEGRTGFVVDGIDDAVAAVERVGQIDRATCRHVFEERFVVTRMARDYLDTYARLKPAASQVAGFADTATLPPHVTPAAAMGVV